MAKEKATPAAKPVEKSVEKPVISSVLRTWETVKADLEPKIKKLENELNTLGNKAYSVLKASSTSVYGFWNNQLSLQHKDRVQILDELRKGNISITDAAKSLDANNKTVEKMLLTIPRHAANTLVHNSVEMGKNIINSIIGILKG